jgi:hypothetical protein
MLRILQPDDDITKYFKDAFARRKALQNLRQQDGVVPYEARPHVFAQPSKIQIGKRAETLQALPVSYPAIERQVLGNISSNVRLPESAAETREDLRGPARSKK